MSGPWPWGAILLGLACGRRSAPLPLHPEPTVIVADAVAPEAGGLRVTLAVVGAPGLQVQRAELALWQGGVSVETVETTGSLAVPFAAGAAGVFRLTGSVYGAYWPGQREIITVDVTGEVYP